MKKNRTYDEKDLDKIKTLLPKNTILYDKIFRGTMKPREKKQFITNNRKLMDLNYFNKYMICL